MAKKFGKFLLLTATAAAVAAGIYYYMQDKNQKTSALEDEDDDFDDFSDDLDSTEGERGYVTLTPEKVTETVKKVAGEAKEMAETVFQEAKDTVTKKLDNSIDSGAEKVEEFFDDDDEEDLEQPDNE